MVVMNKAAIRADGDVNAGSLIIIVARCRNLDECGRLTAADALGLARYADRAAADADLNKVRAGLGEEEEAVCVNNVACADLYAVAVFFADEVDGLFLPAGEALGGVDAQNIRACLDQRRNSLGVVAAVYACADNIALVIVEDLVGIVLVLGVVLAENEVKQSACGVNYGQGIELVIPDNIVCFLERGALGSGDELFKRSHELGNACGKLHAGNAVIAAGDDTEKLAGSGSVLGDGHG